jgi:hypothetical protein
LDAWRRSIETRNSAGRSSGLRLVTTSKAFPGRECDQVAKNIEGLADYSGGPATDLHRFPYYLPRRM